MASPYATVFTYQEYRDGVGPSPNGEGGRRLASSKSDAGLAVE